MERIKQAIEKAKRERGEVLAAARAATPPTFDIPVPSQDLESLTYKRTRVASLKAEHLERNRIVAFNKNDPLSVSFDLLRTQVLRKMDENGWRTLAITSPVAGSGKTVVSINLAMSIAHQTGRTAMLVDFDLRRPKVGEYLGLSELPSLNEVLAGTAALPDALVNPGMPRLVVLPTTRAEAKPAELLASKKVAGLISELRQRYEDRIVLFDLPPLLAVDDAMAVLPHIDCALLVVGNGEVSQTEIKESLRHLGGVNLLGTVLNKAEAVRKKYAYY